MNKPVFSYQKGGFRPYGEMIKLYTSHESVKMAGGTYDAGKTYSLVAYMDLLANLYPGSRMTFVHREIGRVHRNIIPTYYKYLGYKPTPRDDKHPTPVRSYGGEKPEFFEYWNGTRIYTNGVDKPQNLLSDYFDAALVNQAELLPFDAWDELTARVSERAGTMPIAMLVGDCNPGAKHHWILQQRVKKRINYFSMSFLDNPEIVDQSAEELPLLKNEYAENPNILTRHQHLFTVTGWRRVEKLMNLEGLRYKKGFLNEWASEEGLVFTKFEPEIHIKDVTIMPNWRRYLSIDWGFRNPASVLWWAHSPDDRLYCYKEIYKTRLIKTDLIELIRKNMDREDRIVHVAVDSEDQDGVAQLKRAGFRVVEPKKDRVAQIDAIKDRLKVDLTGEPALVYLRDRLVHDSDENLIEEYLPTEVTDEYTSLTYDTKRKGTSRDEWEVVGENHGIDSTAYMIMSLQKRPTIGSGRVTHGVVTLR